MSACPINLDEERKIKKELGKIILEAKREVNQSNQTSPDFLSGLVLKIKEYMPSFYSRNYDRDYKENFVKIIADATKPIKGTNEFLGNPDSIRKYLNDIPSRTSENSPTENTNIIETAEDAKRRQDLSLDFLNKMFGKAEALRRKVKTKFTKGIVDSFLINREEGTVVTSNMELNDNVRKYKLSLFAEITDYLDKSRTVINPIRKDIKNLVMFKDGRYTGALESIKSEIQSNILDKIVGKTSDKLIQLNKDLINAYSAYVMLSNFDSFVKSIFGNNLQILNPGTNQYFKYAFKAKNEKIGDSFLFNSDINVDAEISNIIQQLLSTLELYNWRTRQVYPDSFFDFNKFKHIVCKIKKGVFSPQINDCVFDAEFTKTKVWQELSESTKRVLRGDDLNEDRTLAQIINLAKLNSQNYYHAIFELLSNEKFYVDYKHVYGIKGFNIDNTQELSLLYSLYKGVFENEGKSLFAINSKNPKAHNYYYDVTSVINSLYKTDLSQYYQDPDSGEIRLRGLIDQGLDDSKRQIENDINIKHSLLSNANPDFSYVKEISPIFKKNDTGENELQSECKITIDIPNTNIRATVGSKTKDVLFKDISTNKNINIGQSLWEDENIIKFLDEHLNLNLSETPELLTILKENPVTSLNNLLSFVSKVILTNYVNKKLSDEYGNNLFENLRTAASKLFGESRQVLNNLQQINVIGNTEVRVLYELSRSQAILSSKMYSGTRRDSENKAVSEEVLNRLFECYQSLVEILERRPDSAVRHLSVINSKLIKGVITAREIKTEDSSKKVISSTPAEKMIIATIYNYFYGLLPENSTKSTDILKDNLIALTPSVFSDKPVDGMLLTDLNEEINGKRLADANFDDLLKIFPQEFVKTYDEVIAHVILDLRTLSQFLSVKYPQWNLIMGKKWAKDIKSGLRYITPYSAEFYNDVNSIAASLNMNPQDFLNDLVKEYNQKSDAPITLITEIHYVPTKKGLTYNDVLQGIVDRFRSESDTKQWFKEKDKEMLQSLLSANVSIDLSSDSKVNKLIKSKVGKEWVDGSENLIIAKIKYKDSKGKLVEAKISNKTDLDKILLSLGIHDKFNTIYEAVDSIAQELTFNPELRKLNALDYFISLEFMLVTVGTYAAHKINRSDNSLTLTQKESLLQIAQDKRNNDFTAATHGFDLSDVKGMPTVYNVAVKKDSTAHLYSISKSSYETTPDDGSTDVNPFVVYLENNSLGPQKVGITKKQFVHFYNPKYATGGDIKTAGFGITNSLIRRSFRYQNEMKKMTDLPWKNFNGNILIDYDGNPTKYKVDDDGNPIDLYFKEKGKYYKIENIEYDQNSGLYSRTITEVDQKGHYVEGALPITLSGLLINTNYKLWNLLGGAWSMELNSRGYLDPSEQSIKSTVKFITDVGVKKPGVTVVGTSADVYQPLKHSDIHYLCNVGSIKYGAANINPISDIEGDEPLNYFSIYAISAGVQLDKEHYADNAHLSLMTQVISACAAMGFTFERAQNVFKALALMSNVSSENIVKKIESVDDLRLIATEILTKSSINSTGETSFLDIFTEKLADKVKRGKKLDKNDDIIPFSDNSIFAKAMSTLSVYLTKQGIRLKVPGTLSVISPGHGAMRIYNGKMLDDYDDFETEIEEAQSKIVPLYVKGVNSETSTSQIELGRTYSILRNGVRTEESIDDPIKYKAIKDQVKLGLIDSITENLKAGRELGTYNLRFSSTDGIAYLLWDLDSIQRFFELDLEIADATKAVKNAEVEFYSSLLGTESDEEIENGLKQTVQPYYDVLNQKLQEKNRQKVKVQNDLKALSSNYKGVDKRDFVIIDGVAVVIDPASKFTTNYELIMPKVFATKFGLDKFDSVEKIKKDKYFFTKKLVEKLNGEIDNNKYQLALIKNQGGSVLLAANDTVNISGLLRLTQIITDDEGTYLYDIDGNVVKHLSSEKDKIYLDPSSGNFLIITDNFDYYLDNEHYSDIRISNNVSDENKQVLLDLITNCNNNTARKWIESVGQDINSLYDFGVIDWTNEEQISKLIETNPRFKFIYEQGNGIYNSWLTSLKIIAARIPCQSMQSFMAMDTIAYEQEDVNNAYVSAMQLWLQGSDLDIDAVSLLTFDVNNEGNIELWSPYGNLNDIKGSLELPFPNGKSTEQTKVEDSNLDFSEDANILVELFSGNGMLNLFLTREAKQGAIKNTNIKVSVRTNSDMNKIKAFLEYYLDRINIPVTDNQKSQILSIFKASGNANLAALEMEDVGKLYNGLRKIIDNHNLYLSNPKINRSNKERMINNFIIHNELEIIEDPVNLFEAQTSVDDSTKEVKDIGNNSKKGQATKQQSAGNIFNKSERLYNTQTGKACVGVCAVGLKTFFAITQYCNYLLRYGTEEEQSRLNFEEKVFTYPDGRVITKNKIANIKPDTIDTVKSAQVKDVLLSFIRDQADLSDLEALANETDAAVILSAFLSLATDNAKELQLSKLNANLRTIGMYVYGLSLGMTFKEVSDIMLSDFMNMAIQLTEGNLFDNDEGYYSFSQVFLYFDNGPTELMDKFGKFRTRLYSKIKKDENNGISREDKGSTILLKFLQNQGNLENVINKLELYKQELLKSYDKSSDKILVNKMFDFVEKYAIQYDSIDLNFYNDVKILAQGAEEFRVLGSILALNQGLPTSVDDIRDKIDTIETLISKGERFSLLDFVFDPVYREEQINLYETEKKNTVNILDIISKVPHYFSYLRSLALLDRFGEVCSFKYRSMKSILNSSDLKGIYNPQINKKISDFIGDLIIKDWLFSRQQLIQISKFNYIENGETKSTQDGQIIILGTEQGNKLFKEWMNKVVFKELQQGKNVNSDNVRNNEFVKSLVQTVFTLTYDGNAELVWGSRERMLPSNKFEQERFDLVKNDFNELTSYTYRGYSIGDLLYYYNLIAYRGKLGNQTFQKLFEDKQSMPIIEDFHKFESQLDKSGGAYEIGDFDLNELLMYIAPHQNVYHSNKQFIISLDKTDGKYKLYLKNDEPASEEEQEVWEKYSPLQIQRDNFNIMYRGKYGSVKIQPKGETSIKQLLVNGKTIELASENENPILIFKRSGNDIIFDRELIDSLIENKLNPCE